MNNLTNLPPSPISHDMTNGFSLELLPAARRDLRKQSAVFACRSTADYFTQAAPNNSFEALSDGTSFGAFKIRGAAMKDMMKFKGYFGSVHFNDEDNV
ncbi:MAG: hypothetical protein WCA08_04385, partial [Desulfoferrobacter sp.]